ncbi:MAG: oligosaccharide flippase family protein [Thermoproteales archaeon]|nr:oligosaccharide flippase family protein [Thermoproteales archaeon]
MHAQESKIVKSGLWLYISQLSYAIGGFTFWYVISLLSGSETVGIVSSIMGLATIITSLRTLGTETSLQKFLGEALGKNDGESFNSYLWTTIFFNLTTAFATAILLIFLSILNIKIAGLDNLMLIFTSILTILQLSNILISILNSMLQTKYVAISAIIYNVARVFIGITLVASGIAWVGAALGLIAGSALADIAFILCIKKMLNRLEIPLKPRFSIKKVKELVRAGVVSWLPLILFTVGQWLGLLIINADIGFRASGHYYMAYSIYQIVQTLPIVFVQLMMPVLSGMKDGRKTMTWNVIRISLSVAALVYPLLLIYSNVPLSIIGEEYSTASTQLALLSISIIPQTLITAVTSLAYAYGMYKDILFLGLSINVPRIILYFVLSPRFQGDGVAAAYTIGTTIGMVFSYIVSSRMRFKWNIQQIGEAFVSGLAVSYILNYIIGSWLIVIPLSIIITMLVLLKTKLLTIAEIRQIIKI